MSKISIIMGSQSDLETVKEAINLLKEFKVGFEVKVLSAHRTPKELEKYVEKAPKKGMDSLLSTVQMPAGIPVACMAIGKAGAKNAAIFSLEILAVTDKKIQAKLIKYKKNLGAKIRRMKIKL
jgi:phosphoribosylcarboxyaminoimidazole (NCAIR) mutase